MHTPTLKNKMHEKQYNSRYCMDAWCNEGGGAVGGGELKTGLASEILFPISEDRYCNPEREFKPGFSYDLFMYKKILQLLIVYQIVSVFEICHIGYL